MEIQVTEGLGAIQIGLGEEGSYFKFNRPTSLEWFHYSGTVGKYLCLLPYNEEYREKIRNQINSAIYEDYTGKESELYELIKPIFSLFENGKYNLSYYGCDSDKLNKYGNQEFSSTWEDSQLVFNYDLYTSNSYIHNKTIEQGERLGYYNEGNKSKYQEDMPHTHNYYDGFGSSFIFTQPIEKIDLRRVTFFENEIKEGKRPCVIIFKKRLVLEDTRYYSGDYILDGHHKLMAYENLGIFPPIVSITNEMLSEKELNFDASELAEYMYPWQIDNIKALSHKAN